MPELPGLAKGLGVKNDKVLQFPDTAALLEALKTKRVQVILSDTGSLNLTAAQVAKYPYQHLDYPSDGPFLAGAVAFRKTDTTIYDAFQKELRAMKASGEFDRVAAQFQFPPLPDNLKNTTADEACSKVA